MGRLLDIWMAGYRAGRSDAVQTIMEAIAATEVDQMDESEYSAEVIVMYPRPKVREN